MFSLCLKVCTSSSPAHRATFSLGFISCQRLHRLWGFQLRPFPSCLNTIASLHCHPQLIASQMPTSPSLTAAEVRDENHLKRGLSQQRSCWHGNGCLCEWRLLLRAWSEVSHCLMVQEDPVRLLYKFTNPGFILIF